MSAGMTRRRFNTWMAFSAVTAAASRSLPAWALDTAPIAWASDDPHLTGNFVSIGPEIEACDLQVISGRIPADLEGVYMRNGPNPRLRPIVYAYPMDGDGMIHAVYLKNGRARYRNRYVETSALAVERRAGHAVYGSFTHPVPVDPSLIRPGDPAGPFKNGAFINIIRHGGRLLALDEATTCYEMTMDLDTLGEWKGGTHKPIDSARTTGFIRRAACCSRSRIRPSITRCNFTRSIPRAMSPGHSRSTSARRR